MPNLVSSYHNTRPRVRLELTPVWWRLLTSSLSRKSGEKPDKAREIHCRCVAYALGMAPERIVTKVDAFYIEVMAPTDVTLEQLCARAQQVIDNINAIDITCLEEDEG